MTTLRKTKNINVVEMFFTKYIDIVPSEDSDIVASVITRSPIMSSTQKIINIIVWVQPQIIMNTFYYFLPENDTGSILTNYKITFFGSQFNEKKDLDISLDYFSWALPNPCPKKGVRRLNKTEYKHAIDTKILRSITFHDLISIVENKLLKVSEEGYTIFDRIGNYEERFHKSEWKIRESYSALLMMLHFSNFNISFMDRWSDIIWPSYYYSICSKAR